MDLTTEINSDAYYVQMAQAWLYATIFPKDQDMIYQFIRDNPQSKVAKLTVRRIKSLRHTTDEEKIILTSLISKKTSSH